MNKALNVVLYGCTVFLIITLFGAGFKACKQSFINHENKKRAWFEQCLKDKKQYECDALWASFETRDASESTNQLMFINTIINASK